MTPAAEAMPIDPKFYRWQHQLNNNRFESLEKETKEIESRLSQYNTSKKLCAVAIALGFYGTYESLNLIDRTGSPLFMLPGSVCALFAGTALFNLESITLRETALRSVQSVLSANRRNDSDLPKLKKGALDAMQKAMNHF